MQNSCLSRLDLAILWPKVAKNYGIPKIRVFLGRILVFLWLKVPKNYGVSKIRVFLGRILVFLWPKVPKNYGVSEIHVFLHPDMLKFHPVGELSCWGCELEIECQILYPSVTGKVQNLQRKYTYFFFGQFWCASFMHCLYLNLLRAGGRVESALVLSFYVRS